MNQSTSIPICQPTSQPENQSTSLSNKMKTHKDLKVWNEAIEFVMQLYTLSQKLKA